MRPSRRAVFRRFMLGHSGPGSGFLTWAQSAVVVLAVWMQWAGSVWAGGGGQSMFLIVNPNDENSLRIANAYSQLRAIPDSNFLYITPPTTTGGYAKFDLTKAEFQSNYTTVVANALASRGISNQIDYIGVIGQPSRYVTTGISGRSSFTYGLALNSVLATGLDSDKAYMVTTGVYQSPSSIPIGSNTAIHHSQSYSINYSGTTLSTQYYMAGAIGYTGVLGNSASQVIAGLQQSVAADGTSPVGTVYFEENNDIRSETRESEWPATQKQLNAREVRWVQESNVSGSAPLNRSDVRGAVVGRAAQTLPNGSTYLPGSYVDNLTSYGCTWDDRGQTKTTMFLATGATATAGSVVEPYAISSRFTNSSVHTFLADGSTQAEAFYKATASPDIQMFVGDMLSQPYADVPKVQITSGPVDGSSVSGLMSVSAAGSLTTANIATSIARLAMFVDGRLASTIASSSGTFQLDTTSLSDGRHELRVVAVNNAAAETEGYQLSHVMVNNHGQSVSSTVNTLSLAPTQVVAVPVTAAIGDGSRSFDHIDLRSLGRTLGTLSGTSGSINLDAGSLAYGDNQIVPVAVFNDGYEVAGQTIAVQRSMQLVAGTTPLPVAQRLAGIKAEFFLGKGQSTIAASDFSGTADLTQNYSSLNIFSGLTTNGSTLATLLDRNPLAMPTSSIDHLAARFSGRFNISSAAAGEYEFFLWKSNDSVQLLIDGQSIMGFDNSNYGYTPAWGASAFLGEGEHLLTLLTSNLVTASQANYFDVSLMYRGPDGVSQLADSNFLYSDSTLGVGSSESDQTSTSSGGGGGISPVPEPATWCLVGSGALVLAGHWLWRRWRRAREEEEDDDEPQVPWGLGILARRGRRSW